MEKAVGMTFLSLEAILLWVYNRLVPSLLAIAALVGLWFLGQAVELPVYDLLLRWSAKSASNSPVTLVLIDDESVARLSAKFGPLPWPRNRHLEIFQAVERRHPALMVFDSHFVDIGQAEDNRFFESLSRFPNLLSGVVMPEERGERLALNTSLPAYYRLNLGVVSIQEDGDGVIRKLRPFYQMPLGDRVGGMFPALSIAAAYEFLSRQHPEQRWMMNLEGENPAAQLRFFPEQKPETGIMIPLNEENTFLLRWYRLLNAGKAEYARSHEAIPLWRFFDLSAKVPNLTGRIALIGSSSTFYRDYHQSSMARRHSGPDIHATAIDNILRGESIHRVNPWLNMILLYALCFLTFQIRMGMRSFGKTLLYTLGAMIIYFWLAFWLLAEHSVWVDVATPEMFVVAAFLAGSTFRIFFKEKQLAAMERNLSQLVDPEVFREIRRLSHVLKPGGEKLEITSMFVDIRNFTTLAERLQPHEVTELLNEFYGAIVDIVFAYQGTIDKFMGDGILIIFGAPLPNERHRVLALHAALDILEATERLSGQWQATKNIDTDIGITLNSGVAFVGFLGPTDKLEYTGVGDTVNICVRLQEHTKQFFTRLILSEDTLTGVAESLADRISPEQYLPLGDVVLRGRESTIRIFTLQQALLGRR
jgi:adenylate cyclase